MSEYSNTSAMNNTGDGSQTAWMKYQDYLISVQIWKYASPILIFAGTIANILSIIVLLRKRLRTSTTMFYLTVLSFGDILVLITGLFRYWVKYSFDIDIRRLSPFLCKLHTFIVYFGLDFTSWILVAVTLDRCVYVCLPFRAKRLCTMFHARVAVISIALILVSLNIHLFWGIALKTQMGQENECGTSNPFTEYTWPWIDLCVVSFVPFMIMLMANILITRHLFLSHKRIESHNHQELAHSENSDGVLHHVNGGKRPKQRKISSVTSMLLVTNCVFLITTLPITLFLIISPYIVRTGSQKTLATTRLLWAIANIFQYSNNAIHFFLYSFSGPRFRRELYKLFRIRPHTTHEQTLEMH